MFVNIHIIAMKYLNVLHRRTSVNHWQYHQLNEQPISDQPTIHCWPMRDQQCPDWIPDYQSDDPRYLIGLPGDYRLFILKVFLKKLHFSPILSCFIFSIFYPHLIHFPIINTDFVIYADPKPQVATLPRVSRNTIYVNSYFTLKSKAIFFDLNSHYIICFPSLSPI